LDPEPKGVTLDDVMTYNALHWRVLMALDFDVYIPTAYDFLKMLNVLNGIGEDQTETEGTQLLQLMLLLPLCVPTNGGVLRLIFDRSTNADERSGFPTPATPPSAWRG
jgi:hypothetical protein